PGLVVLEDALVVLPEMGVRLGVVLGELPVDERAAVLGLFLVGGDQRRPFDDEAGAAGDLHPERLRRIHGVERRQPVGVERPLVLLLPLVEGVLLVLERLLVLVDDL